MASISTVTGTSEPVSANSISDQDASQKNGHSHRPRRHTRSIVPFRATRSPGANKYWSTNACGSCSRRGPRSASNGDSVSLFPCTSEFSLSVSYFVACTSNFVPRTSYLLTSYLYLLYRFIAASTPSSSTTSTALAAFP